MDGKPRVIRKVVRLGQDRKPKVVRDIKAKITMERVRAMAPRKCTRRGCKNPIKTGEKYAKVDVGEKQYFQGRAFPVIKDYHFGCVPYEARFLMRFFVVE